MEALVQHLTENWKYYVVAFWVAEKVVKLTPTKYDDILIDIVWGGLKKLTGKGGRA